MALNKITKTTEETEELDTTLNGVEIKNLIDKINEIIDWINNQ
jgi:hypothetical protein